jgi:DNA replication protein DnaC
VLTHPILEQLAQLGLTGMAQAFAELEASGDGATLTHADWLGLLVDREITHRRDKRLATRLRYARLRHNAVVEDVDYRAPRGLNRALFHKLAEGEWIEAHDNLILCGPTGVGKSWLACALGHKACRDNRSVLYHRVPKLFADLALARGDGRHARIMRTLTGAQLLILDDWGLDPLDAGARRDLYECQSAPKRDPRSACNHNPHRRLSSGRPRSPWRGPARVAQCPHKRRSDARGEALWAPGGDPRATGLRCGF